MLVPVAVHRLRWVAAAALIGLTAACGSGEPNGTVTQHEDISANKTAAPTPTVPPTWPLTGLPVGDDGVVRPALAVKIENSVSARPQTGLDQADVVWEEMVEGGISRFVAVYHSHAPEEVGPVRSVRPMDPAITAPTHGLIAFSGGQAPFVAALDDAGLQTISNDRGDDGFYRTRYAAAPHNVYGSLETWWALADGDHAQNPPTQFIFAGAADASSAVRLGTPATNLALTISTVSHPGWAWDAASGTWLRSEGTSAAVTRDGARLSAVNVVVLRVEVRDVVGGSDPAGNAIPETILEGTGAATVATGGQTITGTWTKSGVDGVLQLVSADGAVIRLAPGNTWVELVPTSGTVTVG